MGEHMRILGIRDVNFIDEKTGKPIIGVSIYVAYPRTGVTGEETAKFFLAPDKAASISNLLYPGSEVVVYFNRHGKIEAMEAA